MKKQKKIKTIVHKLGEVHEFGNIYYETRFINRGIAFLCPLDDIEGVLMYYCCVELKIDKHGVVTKV